MWHKYLLLVIALFCYSSQLYAAKGISGTIFLLNGEQVYFHHIGKLNDVTKCHVMARLKGQPVDIDCSDISVIHFPETKVSYQGSGSALIKNRRNEQFTLEEVKFLASPGKYGGFITYVFSDPISKELKDASLKVGREVSHIEFGKTSGRLRYNPRTQKFYPFIFNFDPYTGQKLIWGDENTSHYFNGQPVVLNASKEQKQTRTMTSTVSSNNYPGSAESNSRLQTDAIQFGLDMVNPLKSQKETQDSLNNLQNSANIELNK